MTYQWRRLHLEMIAEAGRQRFGDAALQAGLTDTNQLSGRAATLPDCAQGTEGPPAIRPKSDAPDYPGHREYIVNFRI